LFSKSADQHQGFFALVADDKENNESLKKFRDIPSLTIRTSGRG